MATKTKEADLANEEWRVHTTLPHVIDIIEKELKKRKRIVDEEKFIGYVTGRETLFYKINFEIAKLLNASHGNECLIQHRTPHKKKDFFPWAEWLGGEKKYVGRSNIKGHSTSLKALRERNRRREFKF